MNDEKTDDYGNITVDNKEKKINDSPSKGETLDDTVSTSKGITESDSVSYSKEETVDKKKRNLTSLGKVAKLAGISETYLRRWIKISKLSEVDDIMNETKLLAIKGELSMKECWEIYQYREIVVADKIIKGEKNEKEI